VIEVLVNLPSPILELQHDLLPPKCCELGSVPRLPTFRRFHLRFTFESFEEVGSASL